MITTADITEALNGLGIEPHDTVFVHSEVSRCLRVAGDTREQKLDAILQAFADSVPNGTMIMPTFTYSFCRRELFDLERSPSSVGVLSERFRQTSGVRRTTDPIFSTAVLGALPGAWEQDLFAVSDTDCFGERSVFAYLREADAKLVFFGVAPTACTFIHHVEQRERVRYRYFKTFRGVVAHRGGLTLTSARYYVRDLDDAVETFLVPLVERLRATGELAETGLARGPVISSYSARAAAAAAVAGMRENPSYLLERGHPELAHLRYG